MEYRDSHRQLQDRFDTRRLADRLAEVAGDVVAHFRDFIEARDMFFIATADASGQPQCSYKGGDPGFVRVVDDHTIAFPIYDGNGMFLTTGNLAENPAVGLLFIDFSDGSRLRLNGDASIEADGPLVESFPGALFAVRVQPSVTSSRQNVALRVSRGRKRRSAAIAGSRDAEPSRAGRSGAASSGSGAQVVA